MSSPSSDNVSSREANRPGNDIQESQLPQNRNPSEMDTVEDLTRKLHQAEKQNVELINQRNREMSRYEKEIMKLRLELEREEVIRQGLQSEISFARKEACIQMYSAEDELCEVKTKLVELQALNDKHQQKAAETEKLFKNAQWEWEEEQQRFSRERDNIRRLYVAEMEFLIKEKSASEKACQETNATLQHMRRMLRDMEIEHNGCSEMLRLQANHLDFKAKRQETLMRELEAATVKTKKLEENAEAARLAHLQCKYTTEIMQLRIQELEDALNAEKGGMTEDLSVVANTKKDFRESENARGREQNVLQRQHMQGREGTGEKKDIGDSSGRLVDAGTSFSLQEGPLEQLPILLGLYQCMAQSRVLAKQPDGPLDGLSATEFCTLLCENIEALIVNFHKANERISHLEYICKHKTDTMNDLQQNQEDAFEKMSEQLKAQEHCWQKEKQYLEQQYSNLLAEAHTRAQECEQTAQKNRQKLYGLEQICEKLVHENASVRNTLANAQKERSSLLAACALLSGALCPLYGRLCAMSSQRDLLQDQVNLQGLVNQKVASLLRVFPTNVESLQDEARLRQRRAKALVYVFRRAVIAVLASNRLRLLAQHSSSLFIWTDGSRGSTGIRVCVGESRGRRNVSRFEEEGVDCIEALDWLTSSNLYTAIISSVSELQDVLSKSDPKSWLSGHSLISAARNSFAKLMDNLSILMEAVQVNSCRCAAYLERDSLIQRLACGLHRVNAQALEAGLYDRLPTTRNIAILQQEVFEFSRRLRTAEAECCSLNLQLAEFKWTFNEMQKDADKAHRLQEQLNALQHRIITQDNIHEELDNALQREHEAKLLLQEHERRLQELSNRLEVHTTADVDRSQDLNVSLKSLSEASEELRRRDRVLNHQKKLLKDMEQDRQRLLGSLQEAEHDLHKAAKDKELLINHMKAVHATVIEAGDRFASSGYGGSMSQSSLLLPSLDLQTLSEEEMRGRPEARAFQNVLESFMSLYATAAAYVKLLTVGRDSYRIRFPSQAAGTPPAPARGESFWGHFEPQATSTPPAPVRDESFRVRLEPQAARTPPAAARDDIFQPYISPQAADTPPAAAPAPAPASAPAPARDETFQVRFEPQAARTPPAAARDDIFQPYISPQAASTPPAPAAAAAPAPTPARDESFRVRLEPQAARTPPAAARDESFWLPVLPQVAHPPPAHARAHDESFWHRIGQQLARTPPTHARESDEPFQPRFVPRGAVAPPGPETDDIFRVRLEPQAAHTPPAAARDESFRRRFGHQGATGPRDIFQPYISPQAAGTPPAPAPAAARDEPSLLPFAPRGSSTPRGLEREARGRRPRHQHFSFRPESWLDQSHNQDFRPLPAETEMFSNVIPHRTYTVSPSNTPSSVTPRRIGTGSSMDISSGLIPYRTYTMSATNIPSTVSPGRTGPGSFMDISSGSIPRRTVSAPNTHSSVTRGRTDIGSSVDISSGVIPYPQSSAKAPSNVIPTRSDIGSSMDKSSRIIRNTTFTMPSSMTWDETGGWSSMDESSRIIRNTTFTMPSNLIGTGTGSSVNTSFFFRPRRTSSLPSVRSFSPGVLSSTRRNQEI